MPKDAVDRFIDEHFYYALQGKEKLESEPKGGMVVSELIAGRPCFRVNKGIQQQRKTLIIADWTMVTWTPLKCRRAKEIIKRLLNAGFSIFIWEEKRLQPLTEMLFIDLVDNKPEKIRLPVYPDSLAVTAAQALNLSKDAIQVVDPHWMDSLLDPEKYKLDRPLQFNQSSYPFYSKSDAIKLGESLQSLQQTPYSIQEVIYDQFSSNTDQIDEVCQTLKKWFPAAEHKTQYDRLIIRQTRFDQQQWTISSLFEAKKEIEKKEIQSKKFDLFQIDLKKIVVLEIVINEDKCIFSTILKSCPNLKVLSLKSITSKSKIMGDTAYPSSPIELLHPLEVLTLATQVDTAALDMILQSIPNIKSLILSDDKNPLIKSKDSQPQKFQLLSLENLECKYTDPIGSEYVRNILLLSPNLQSVTLKISPFLNLSSLRLPCLQKIKLSGEREEETIEPGSVEQDEKKIDTQTALLNSHFYNAYRDLLNASEGTLEKIELEGSITKNDDLPVTKLNSVKMFYVESITAEILVQHLQNMPKLQSLSVNTIEMLSYVLPASALQHNELTYLIILAQECHFPVFNWLLESAPNLNKLSLYSNIINIGDFSARALSTLQRVEELDLNSSCISTDVLINLLKKMPNLKRINISNIPISHASSIISEIWSEIFRKEPPEIRRSELDDLLEEDDESKESKKSMEYEQSLQEPEQHVLSEAMHQPELMRDFKPQESPFQFKNQNKTFNQGMIIEKVSQYLTVTQRSCAHIPKIQTGICLALSHLFIEMSSNKEDWQHFLTPIQDWTGQKKLLTRSLEHSLNRIFEKIEQYQFKFSYTTHYVGVKQLNKILGERKPHILENPWHAIAVVPHDIDSWTVYDPNIKDGPIIVPNGEDVLTLIQERIGRLVCVSLPSEQVSLYSYHSIVPVIDDVNAFIEEGGLLVLKYCDNKNEILNTLYKKGFLNLAALEGLTLRNMLGIPAWAQALEDDSLKNYVHMLLSQWLADNKEDAIQKLTHSIQHLSPYQKGEIITQLVQLQTQQSQRKESKDEREKKEPSRDTFDELIKSISESSNQEHYEKQLETWKKELSEEQDAKTFAYNVFKKLSEKKDTSCLIECTSDDVSERVPYILYEHAKHLSTPVFHVYSPDDLVCSAPWVMRKEKKDNKQEGIIHDPPGGALHHFLEKNKNSNPVLIVHYDHFTPNDMIRFNALLDETPNADGYSLPEGTKVIGVMNVKKSGAYQGSDFYSRFKHREPCPVTEKIIMEAVPPLNVSEKTRDEKTSAFIDLYNGADWKSELLGRWKLNGDQLYFEEGQLLPALKQLANSKEKILEIRHGLWGQAEFQHFWHQALADGFVEYDGRRIEIPLLHLVKVHGYVWDKKIIQVTQGLSYDDKTVVLNPSELYLFFEKYRYDANKLYVEKGVIAEQKAGSVLHVNLTRSLTNDQWSKLLDHCNKQNITLHVHAATEVMFSFPPDLVSPSEVKEQKEKGPSAAEHTRFLAAEDLDEAVLRLKEVDKNWKVIDISECSSNHLMMCIDGKWDEDKKRFYFEETKKALLTLLENNENVILKGTFSPELADALAPLLLQRLSGTTFEATPKATFEAKSVAKSEATSEAKSVAKSESTSEAISEAKSVATPKAKSVATPKATSEVKPLPPQGRLVLLTSQQNAFNVLPCEQQKKLTIDDKKAYLKAKGYKELKNIEPSLWETASCSQLEAHCLSDDPWVGMRDLPKTIMIQGPCNFKKSKQVAEAFTQKRLTSLNQVLASSPYAFITGLTGIGKSTFIQQDYLKDLKSKNGRLYQGESTLEEWARDKAEGSKILFIDEANLSSRQWSEFEGLFQDPPGILIDGNYYPLSKEHKVIFAGNPVSYGDERMLASLFNHHGNAVLFEPMPLESIYHSILTPILEQSRLDPETKETICHFFFNVYQFVLSFSSREVLISPRELQTMVLLTIAHAEDYPAEAATAAEYYAYLIAINILPKDQQEKFPPSRDYKLTRKERKKEEKVEIKGETKEEIKEKQKEKIKQEIKEDRTGERKEKSKEEKKEELKQESKEEKQPYLVTPSREPICHILDDMFKLRELRLSKRDTASDNYLYGGLGGVVLEGIPAAGKSELVIARLLASGLKKGTIAKAEEVKKDKLTKTDKKNNVFYYIPVSMSVTEKTAVLRKAFDEGAVVMIDEINSSPMMERLLNAMLMGHDENGIRPNSPGFMVIGTQNPATMGGRRVASNALSRRLMTLTVPPYNIAEIIAILVHKGVSTRRAEELANAFIVKLKKAKDERLQPAPTLRDLLKLAKEVIQSEEPLQKTGLQKLPEKTELKSSPEKKDFKISTERTEMISLSELTEVKSPSERTAVISPSERTEVKSPSERTEVKSPSERTEVKSPSERTEVKSPSERTEVKSPSERTEAKLPIKITEVISPSGETLLEMPREETLRSPTETELKTPLELKKEKKPMTENKHFLAAEIKNNERKNMQIDLINQLQARIQDESKQASESQRKSALCNILSSLQTLDFSDEQSLKNCLSIVEKTNNPIKSFSHSVGKDASVQSQSHSQSQSQSIFKPHMKDMIEGDKALLDKLHSFIEENIALIKKSSP
jgi:hypothetical protein